MILKNTPYVSTGDIFYIGRNIEMKLEPFVLERYFAKHEFSAKYLLSSSDCEAFYMEELLESADAQSLRLWENLKLGIIQGHHAQRAYQQEAGVS